MFIYLLWTLFVGVSLLLKMALSEKYNSHQSWEALILKLLARRPEHLTPAAAAAAGSPLIRRISSLTAEGTTRKRAPLLKGHTHTHTLLRPQSETSPDFTAITSSICSPPRQDPPELGGAACRRRDPRRRGK